MLRSIRLQDFKSFADEEVELSPLTVLVGANASGKSNLLDALRFLQGAALDMNLADVLRGRWEGGRLSWPGIRGGTADAIRKGEERFGITTRWRLARECVTHEISYKASGRLAQEKLTTSMGGGYLLDTQAGTRGGSIKTIASAIPVALKGAERSDSPTQFHASVRSLLQQIKMSPRVSEEVARVRDLLLDALRRTYFLDITPSLMRGFVPQHMTELGLEGENVSALAWSLCQDPEAKADLVDWLSELCAPELVDIDFAKTDLGDVMLVLVEAGNRRIPARSLSDGTLRFLGELLALKTAPEGSLLLVEELENGLHPTRAHLLVEAMEAATRARNIQVIATTHSPMVLNALSKDALGQAVLVARPPESEGSRLKKLVDLPDFEEVERRRGIDQLLSAGWLERAL